MRRAFLAAAVACLATACFVSFDPDGQPCDAQGQCLSGYACDSTNHCRAASSSDAGRTTGDGGIPYVAGCTVPCSAGQQCVHDQCGFFGHGTGIFIDGGMAELDAGFDTPVLADLDHDGRLDAVFSFSGASPGVAVLMHPGDGLRAAPRLFVMRAAPLAPHVADIDEDGIPDLVVPTLASGFGLYRGLGDGGFTSLASVNVGCVPVKAADVGDVDQDHHADIVATCGSDGGISGLVAVLHGWGDGGFGRPTATLASEPNNVRIVDYDHDGQPDLLLSTHDRAITIPNVPGGAVSFMRGSASGFQPASELFRVTDDGGSFDGLAPGDLDGDGKLDVVLGWRTYPGYQQYASWGYGNAVPARTQEPVQLELGSAAVTMSVVLGDFAGTGKLDVISSGGPVFRIPAEGAGFGAPQQLDVPGVARGVATADLDGDGKLDLLICEPASSELVLRLGR